MGKKILAYSEIILAVFLWATIEILGERAALDDKDLFAPIRSAMSEVKDANQDLFDRFNFEGIIPELF